MTLSSKQGYGKILGVAAYMDKYGSNQARDEIFSLALGVGQLWNSEQFLIDSLAGDREGVRVYFELMEKNQDNPKQVMAWKIQDSIVREIDKVIDDETYRGGSDWGTPVALVVSNGQAKLITGKAAIAVTESHPRDEYSLSFVSMFSNPIERTLYLILSLKP